MERKKKELQGNLLYENVNRGFGKQCVLIVCTCVLQQQYIFIHDCLKDYLEKKLAKDECLYENQAFGEISK